MPVTKTIWRGKVGTRDFGAYNVIVPIMSMPRLLAGGLALAMVLDPQIVERRIET